MATLEQLMALEKPSPKQVELQARYSNAQFAVDLGYRLAIANLPGESFANRIDVARLLKIEIEKDLNDTLKVLEVVADGAKTDAPKLP